MSAVNDFDKWFGNLSQQSQSDVLLRAAQLLKDQRARTGVAKGGYQAGLIREDGFKAGTIPLSNLCPVCGK
ncbi:MAG: hypothetical protein EOP04_00760 [Proteobacteria bacterium]|nr:MAG: hypothetical protein EOP04_00760 [Pseudomonadota bacterium]